MYIVSYFERSQSGYVTLGHTKVFSNLPDAVQFATGKQVALRRAGQLDLARNVTITPR